MDERTEREAVLEIKFSYEIGRLIKRKTFVYYYSKHNEVEVNIRTCNEYDEETMVSILKVLKEYFSIVEFSGFMDSKATIDYNFYVFLIPISEIVNQIAIKISLGKGLIL